MQFSKIICLIWIAFIGVMFSIVRVEGTIDLTKFITTLIITALNSLCFIYILFH